MIILIYLILLFKSFFSSTIYHYQNTEEIQLDSLHINKSLDLFCKTYNNDFWGERKRTGLESQKQKALLEEIRTIFKESGLIRLKKILKSAFICSIEEEVVVEKSIFLRVPVYYGAIQTALFNNDYFLQLRKHLNEKWYDYDDEIKIFDKTHIVFPALITPYYKWTKENTLVYAGEMGVVVSNGVNFESTTSSDYKKFMPEIKQGNKTNLIKFIDAISQCLVYAAYKLAINKEVKVINLNIPSFGVSSFGACYPNKEELASFYFNAIYTALEGYKDVIWYVDFHNYNKKKHYREAFITFIEEIKKNRKCSYIVLSYHEEINLYNEDLMPENIRDMSKKKLSYSMDSRRRCAFIYW